MLYGLNILILVNMLKYNFFYIGSVTNAVVLIIFVIMNLMGFINKYLK